MTDATSAALLPTEVYALEALICATPAGDREAIRDRLTKQLGDTDAANDLFDRAESEAIRGDGIVRLRKELAAVLTEARGALNRAEGLVSELAKQVYDVEYVEGIEAVDLLHLVKGASRSVRTAQVLQKHMES
jgi:hypothetical protein